MTVTVIAEVTCDGCGLAETYDADELLEDRPGRHNESIHAVAAAALLSASAATWAAPLRLSDSPVGVFCPECVLSGAALAAVAEACGITGQQTLMVDVSDLDELQEADDDR